MDLVVVPDVNWYQNHLHRQLWTRFKLQYCKSWVLLKRRLQLISSKQHGLTKIRDGSLGSDIIFNTSLYLRNYPRTSKSMSLPSHKRSMHDKPLPLQERALPDVVFLQLFSGLIIVRSQSFQRLMEQSLISNRTAASGLTPSYTIAMVSAVLSQRTHVPPDACRCWCTAMPKLTLRRKIHCASSFSHSASLTIWWRSFERASST